jgi:PST family polysaccharide transporter
LNLLGTSALSAIQTAFKILAGFVLVKVVVLAAGPQGVAQLGQFQNLVAVIAILAGGMFYTGVTKLVAECADDRGRVFAVIHAALKASLLAFACVASVVAVWHDEIAAGILKNGDLGGFVLVLPLLVFLSVLNGLWLAVLNGYRRVRELVLANIACSVLMIVMTIALALPFGEVGAYVSILTPPAIVLFAVLLWRFDTAQWTLFKTVAQEQMQPYPELGRFAVMGLVSAVTAPVAQMVMREYLVNALSIDQAGIWQGVTRISEIYLVFITSSLSVYFLPKLAQTQNNLELRHLVSSVLKLVIPVSLLLGGLIYLCRDLLIELLFTADFSSMRDLFFWQIAGDMIKIISWIFAYVVLVRGAALVFVIGEVVFNCTYPLLGMLFVPTHGLLGAVAAYGVNYIFYLVYMMVAVFLVMNKNGNVDE